MSTRRLGKYLGLLTGPRRTIRFDSDLACLLVLVSGGLNAVGFVAVAVYTSHMSGMVADLAQHLVAARWSLLLLGVSGVAAFALGAGVTAGMLLRGTLQGSRARYANVLLLEGVLMTGIGVGAAALDPAWAGRQFVLIPALCFTMGLQNALITRVRDFPVRTTHLTGMITDLAVEVGRALESRRSGAGPQLDREKVGVLGVLVLLFVVGGAVGALGYRSMGFTVLVVGGVLLVLASLPPVLLQSRRLRRRVLTAPRPTVVERVGAVASSSHDRDA